MWGHQVDEGVLTIPKGQQRGLESSQQAGDQLPQSRKLLQGEPLTTPLTTHHVLASRSYPHDDLLHSSCPSSSGPLSASKLLGAPAQKSGDAWDASIRRLLGNQGSPRLHPRRMGHPLFSMDRGLCGTKMGRGRPESRVCKGRG